MVVFFKSLEICNFKSFKDKVTISFSQDFVAIMGPNGCGKSNVIDAICFVMCAIAAKLRVKQISELIHGASIGKPVKDRVSVTAFFELQDGTCLTFNRSIRNNRSEFRINDEVVSVKEYKKKLEELGINTDAQNFVIHQGMVDTLATQTAKERTQQFEKISNSGELENEYNSLKDEEYQASLKVCDAMQVKKDLVLEKKSLLYQMNEADAYNKLEKHYMKQQLKLHLCRLYHIQKDVENYLSVKEDLESKISNKQEEKAVMIEAVKEIKKECFKLSEELTKTEEHQYEIEVQCAEKRLSHASIKETVAQLQMKITTSKGCLAKAKSVLEARNKTIKDIEDALQVVKEQLSQCESQLSQCLSPADSVDMTGSQLNEYHKLKAEVVKQTAQYMVELNHINNEQDPYKDSLENKKRQKMELEDEVQRKMYKKETAMSRINKLEEFIKTTEIALNEQMKMKDKLQTEITKSKHKMPQLQDELNKVIEQRQGAKKDKYLIAKMKDNAEIIRDLKDRYSGVYGRLSDLCKPIRPSFNLAVAKVFGRHMDSIIITTEKEAIECIKYLKEARISRETFLPLDTLKVNPLKTRLRSINERNVKLLYDVVNFSPKEIDKAILFVTDNTLVCETPEDANYVAFEMNPNEYYNCVSLDGTYYKRTGIMSGGEVEVQRNARKWDANLILELKSKEENLRKELKLCADSTRKDDQLQLINVEITVLQSRLRFSPGDLAQEKKQVSNIDTELEEIKKKLQVLSDSIAEIESNMTPRSLRAKEIESRISEVEDQVFHDFCRDIGVNNIREYEKRELVAYQAIEKKRTEAKEQYERIYNQLQYEKDSERFCTAEKNVERWERVLEETKRNYETAKEEEKQSKTDFELHLRKLQKIQGKCDELSKHIDELHKTIASIQSKLNDVSKEIIGLERNCNSVKLKIQKAKADWESIFQNAKDEDIPLPTISRSSVEHSETHSSSGMNSQELQEYFLQIDFSTLSSNYKNRSPDSIEQNIKQLTVEVSEISRKLNSFSKPNSKAGEKIDELNQKLVENAADLKEKKLVANYLAKEFRKVQQERLDRFSKCLLAISIQIEAVYKSLMGSDSAQAILVPENPEEPYLGGIRFDCIVPGKKLHAMSQQSGGEKTLAVLALLFAQCNYLQPPFLLLDEIDASLDNHNIRRVAEYIKKSSMQVIAVSLKSKFSSRADSVIGVTAKPSECIESKIYGLPRRSHEKKQDTKTI